MEFIKIFGTKVKMIGCTAALAGSLFCISPVTAFAGGLECTCETKCTEDCIDPDCPLCQEDYHNCEGAEPAEEPEEEWGPLTPDGNMTIVDDYGSLEAGGKQFITVVTKNGNYFYIIIDRDDEGEETVHFLNMVDESDLLSLMDEDEVSEYISVTGIGGSKKEEVVEETPEPEPEPEEEEPAKEEVVPEKKTNVNGIMAIVLILAVAGVGGYFYYNTTKNSKKKSAAPDPDAGYDEMDYLSALPTEEEDWDEDDTVKEDDDSSGMDYIIDADYNGEDE